MTDGFGAGSFDRASLSPEEYAALRDRLIRTSHAERARAMSVAVAWLATRMVRLCRFAAKPAAAKRAANPAHQIAPQARTS